VEGRIDGLQGLKHCLSFFGKSLQGHKSSENHWQMGQEILFRGFDAKSVDDLPWKFQLQHQEKPVKLKL